MSRCASFKCLSLVSFNLPVVTISFRRVQVKLEDDEKKDTTMKWYSYLILLFMYIVYLGLGAYVFQRFEQPNEVLLTPSFLEQHEILAREMCPSEKRREDENKSIRRRLFLHSRFKLEILPRHRGISWRAIGWRSPRIVTCFDHCNYSHIKSIDRATWKDVKDILAGWAETKCAQDMYQPKVKIPLDKMGKDDEFVEAYNQAWESTV